jgi:homogentisate 1,2-dioxygenase
VPTEAGSPTESVKHWRSAPDDAPKAPIAQMRWDPHPVPDAEVERTTFITGIRTITTGGDVEAQTGFANSVYTITDSMVDEYFYNGDAEMLFVLEHNPVRFCTKFGVIDAEPGEIVVVPRGVKLRVEVPEGPARGYLCENYGGAFTLPERGPRRDARPEPAQLGRIGG